MKWQPIETAPKDGSSFLAYDKEGNFICILRWNKWDSDQGRLVVSWDGTENRDCTHWMPLPKQPSRDSVG